MEEKMKKHKILLVVISALTAVGMIFAAACGGGYSETQNGEKLALLDLAVDFGAAKATYNLGEELDTSGLFCSAKIIDVETGAVTVDEDIADDVVIDGSEFNNQVVGIYNVYVRYTYADVTREKSYPVEVVGKDATFGGIVVEYVAGTVDRVTLQTGVTQTEITVGNSIVVKQVDASGNVTGTLSPSDYDVGLYKGSVKQNSWTVGGGAYTIRATLKSNPNVSSFVSYYVIDDMVDMTFDSANSVVTQTAGEDVISSTWKFIITYQSGATKVVTLDMDGFIYALDSSLDGTKKAGIGYASIQYKEKSALGVETSKVFSVTYTVTD